MTHTSTDMELNDMQETQVAPDADAIEEITAPTEEVAAPVEETVAKDLNAILLRAAVAHRNAERAKQADEAATADVVKVLGRKGSRTVMNPLRPEEEFVQVTVSKLTYSAKAEDPSATEEWIRQRYSEKVETQKRITTKFSAQDIIKILEDLAPFLLEPVEVIPPHVIGELERKSRQAQQPMGFGGEIGKDAPPGIVVTPSTPKVYVTFRNADVVDELIINKVVDMEGNLLGGDE